MVRIMGVDPGLSGGLGLIDTKTGEVIVDDMPVRVLSTRRVRRNGKMVTKVKRVVDGKAVGDWIEKHRPHRACIELVASRPYQGVSTTFTFGEAYGCVSGAIEAMNVPLDRVTPLVWKRKLGLIGASKRGSLDLARKKFKRAANRLDRMKDNGRAEALLIAEYATLH